METSEVDPRDVRWQMAAKAYRVHFWTPPAHSDGMWSCSEVRITDVESITEVLQWSSTLADGRDVVVHLELEEQPGALGPQRGLIRIHGRGPDEAARAERHGR